LVGSSGLGGRYADGVEQEPARSRRAVPRWVVIIVWAIAVCLAGAVITGMFLY